MIISAFTALNNYNNISAILWLNNGTVPLSRSRMNFRERSGFYLSAITSGEFNKHAPVNKINTEDFLKRLIVLQVNHLC